MPFQDNPRKVAKEPRNINMKRAVFSDFDPSRSAYRPSLSRSLNGVHNATCRRYFLPRGYRSVASLPWLYVHIHHATPYTNRCTSSDARKFMLDSKVYSFLVQPKARTSYSVKSGPGFWLQQEKAERMHYYKIYIASRDVAESMRQYKRKGEQGKSRKGKPKSRL